MGEGGAEATTRVRAAVPGDAAAISAVLDTAFGEFRPLYTAEAFAATAPASTRILARMREGPVWVAMAGEEVIGTVSAVVRGAGVYIRGMAVAPSARGRGVGGLLLKTVENFARAHGYERLLLSTTPFLAGAIRLYERFGFRRADEGPQDLFGTPLFTMVKYLPAYGGTAITGGSNANAR